MPPRPISLSRRKRPRVVGAESPTVAAGGAGQTLGSASSAVVSTWGGTATPSAAIRSSRAGCVKEHLRLGPRPERPKAWGRNGLSGWGENKGREERGSG